MQVTYFLTGPMFNLLFYCHIISYWEKVPPYEKSKVQFIPLKSKLSGKFQRFNAIDASIEMLKNSCVFQLKWKNAKHFTRLKQRAALSRLISFIFLPRDKTFLQRYTVYRNIQTFGFKVLQECSSWASRKCAVQISFFWPQTETWLLENLQSERGFWLCFGSIYYFQWQVTWGL